MAFLRDSGPWGARLLPADGAVWASMLRCRLDPVGAARLGLKARSWRPDVVFSIDERNSMVLSRWVGLLTGATVVTAIHSTPRVGRSPWWDRLTRGQVSRFLALSPAHARHLETAGVLTHRIIVVPNGVVDQDPVERPRPPGHPVVCVFAGVLRGDKRVDVLLKAMALCAQHAPLLRLHVAGDGPEAPRLRSTARALGIDARVSWLGCVDDVNSVLREADILVLPSDAGVETLSMAALEAMAVGLPVIATDVGSMEDAITPDVGILVKPGNPDSLANALMRLYEDGSLRAALGRAAWRRQRRLFSSSSLCSRMEAVLTDAARQRISSQVQPIENPGRNVP